MPLVPEGISSRAAGFQGRGRGGLSDVHQRSLPGDGHRLRQRANFHRLVQLRRESRAQPNFAQPQRLEPGQLVLHRVRANRQRRQTVFAALVGHRGHGRNLQRGAPERDGHARKRRAAFVRHLSEDVSPSLGRLRGCEQASASASEQLTGSMSQYVCDLPRLSSEPPLGTIRTTVLRDAPELIAWVFRLTEVSQSEVVHDASTEATFCTNHLANLRSPAISADGPPSRSRHWHTPRPCRRRRRR